MATRSLAGARAVSFSDSPLFSPMSDTTSTNLASRGAVLSVFEGFRDELDDHNDRRERLIKVRYATRFSHPHLNIPQ